MSNIALWNEVCKTDPQFTKQFKRGGGFSGTAIQPMYLMRRATEMFGPIGIGWGFAEIESKIAAEVWFSKVELWYKHGDQRGVVQQWGATTLVNYRKKKDARGNVLLDATGNEITEPLVDEEAAKKAVTDGATKCLSYIGFGADIHMGMFDDNKYMSELMREKRGPKTATGAEPDANDGSREAQQRVAAQKIDELKAAGAATPLPNLRPATTDHELAIQLQASIEQASAKPTLAKPPTAPRQAMPDTKVASDFQTMLNAIHKLKVEFESLNARDRYYFVLGQNGIEKSNQIRKVDMGRDVYKQLLAELKQVRDRTPIDSQLGVSAADMPLLT